MAIQNKVYDNHYDYDDITPEDRARYAKEVDNVNHPAHYQANGIETIDVIEAWTKDLDGIVAVCTANVIKYISRWHKKNGVEDLKKAQWYLNKLIEVLSRE